MLIVALLARALAAAHPVQVSAAPQTRVLDDFEQISTWTAHPSEGVSVTLHLDAGVRGRALRIDFDFHGGSGYALVRRRLDLDLPPNYAFGLYLRGESPNNNLEFKLVDSTGDNVWWSNQRDFEFPARWTKITRRKRHIQFAWGPVGGGEIKRVAALEIAITAGRGGKGSVWLDELTLTSLEPDQPYNLTPKVTASSSARAHAPALAVDGDTSTFWQSGTGDAALTLDFLRSRELGGVVIDWSPRAPATRYALELSDDGALWRVGYDVTAGSGRRDYLPLPEAETRFLRVRVPRPAAIRELRVQPVAWSATRNAMFESIAGESPRGSYPRYFDRQMVYWTVAGVSGDTRQALVSEDGAVEPFAFEWSLEPFLRVDDTLLTWADVSRRPSLAAGSLPVPTVEWTHGDLSLAVTTFVSGAPDSTTLLVRYRLRNAGAAPRNATLFVAIRPFQVNTPWQFLNGTGGAARIRSITYDGAVVRVRGADSTRIVAPLTTPSSFGAATFDNGSFTELLRSGRLPPRPSVSDPMASASGALGFGLALPARGVRDVYVAVPLHRAAAIPRRSSAAATAVLGEEALATAIHDWEVALSRSVITLPPSARRVSETLRSSVAYMLLERHGAALQPGTRAYARSWIRDGALMSAALERLGQADAARQFIDWFLPFQRPDGRVPCCVDARGADPVPEHDSHGELIYLVAEYWRLTGDSAFAARAWPHVALAVAYIDSLRRTHMSQLYQTDSGRVYFGLLPPSISHEGYSAKPMHSYWDDFFALKGLSDAADLAAMLGRTDDQRRIAALRDEFRHALLASIGLSMARHAIDYIPGSADLGDFDATSTTIAVAPGGELGSLPPAALQRTFEKYYENFAARRDGRLTWDAYTPYELRAIGTFVRLGDKRRAHELLDFFLHDQRPQAWRQWAEVVWKDSLAPKFIGDMPHAWVASDYVRSVLDCFAYERTADSALVLGAGIPETWVREEPGVDVRGLRTYYGTLGYSMRMRGKTVVVRFTSGLRVPPGGIVVRSPLARALSRAVADGTPVAIGAGEVVLRRLTRELVLLYRD